MTQLYGYASDTIRMGRELLGLVAILAICLALAWVTAVTVCRDMHGPAGNEMAACQEVPRG